MNWFVYQLDPIDFNWEHLPTVESVAISLASQEAKTFIHYGNADSTAGVTYREFTALWASAKDAAGSKGWDGDFRVAPSVLWIPVEDSFSPGFVFKQDNNGTTFVVSPAPLPHLEY